MTGEQPESEPGPQPAYELWDLTEAVNVIKAGCSR